jgi:hypothetical protein
LLQVERYTAARKAEFILSNATNDDDYRKARGTVRKLGLDPDTIAPAPPETTPTGSRIRSSAGRQQRES